jgi:hypothetical protein
VAHFANDRKAFGSIPVNHLSTSLSVLSSLLQRLPWRFVLSEYFLVKEGRKKSGVTGPGNMEHAPKPSHRAWQGIFMTTNNRCAGALSCRRNQLFHAHHENYVTRKPAFSSLTPYHILHQAFVTSVKEIVAERNIYIFARCSVKFDEPASRRCDQRADT